MQLFARWLRSRNWQFRSRNYDVINGTTSDRFFSDVLFLAMLIFLCFWVEWRHNVCLGQKMTTSDLWHCILTFRISSEVTDLGRPYTCMQWLNWRFLELLRSWDRICGSFFTWICYWTSSPFPTSIRAIGSVCTTDTERYRNDTSFCSEFHNLNTLVMISFRYD